MTASQLRGTVCALVIVVCAAFLAIWLRGFGPPFDPAPHKALGVVLAEEALKLRGGSGKVTLIARDTQTYRNPAADAQVESFKRTLKASGATLSSVYYIKMNPIRLTAVPTNDFFRLIARQSSDDVIVSLLGPPVLTDALAAELGQKRPKIVAVCSGSMPRQVDLRNIFQQGLLDLAVISIEHLAPVRTASGSREQFDHLFKVVTTQNLSDLPLVAKSSQ